MQVRYLEIVTNEVDTVCATLRTAARRHVRGRRRRSRKRPHGATAGRRAVRRPRTHSREGYFRGVSRAVRPSA